jgi:hypothetical protein
MTLELTQEKGYALSHEALRVMVDAAMETGFEKLGYLQMILRHKGRMKRNAVKRFWEACARKAPAFGTMDDMERHATLTVFVMTLETLEARRMEEMQAELARSKDKP